MRLFINSLAANAGGGLTYIRNTLPLLAANPDLQITVAIAPSLRREFSGLTNIEFLEQELSTSRRFQYEQNELPREIREHRSDVLLSAGNFALRKSPVPQILLSRNSVYTSRDFYRDLWSRGEYRAWMETHFRGWLARKSIKWADVTVAPSRAFADELHRWTGKDVRAIHHGFDSDTFFRDDCPLSPEVEAKLTAAEGSFRLLFVSHYNYYRNFETLLRALPLIQRSFAPRAIKLLLTCKFLEGQNPGAYHPESAARMVRDLNLRDVVVELGAIPYHQLHLLYRRADLYVTPAYTETFAHPLVEAMASSLPIVASDLAVHREICAEAARYFPTFSPTDLAETVAQVAEAPTVGENMAANGRKRVGHFSWKKHVSEILELAKSLIDA